MILVAVMAELLEVYTTAVARAMERLLCVAPLRILPRRVRFIVLRTLPFVAPSPPVPPPHAVPAFEDLPRGAMDACAHYVIHPDKPIKKLLWRQF
ncbi:hypothetical protein ZWY2020_048349 [Hordeum vulgare]|nr:hypothetical protein ZWY2020_048349 [Hordeum vulgare]